MVRDRLIRLVLALVVAAGLMLLGWMVPVGIAPSPSPEAAARAFGGGMFRSVAPAPRQQETASIEFTMTVGTVEDICSNTDTLVVRDPTDVYFCYTVQNTGDVTLTQHTLQDDLLGLLDYTISLPPGKSTFRIPKPAFRISDTVTNQATWTASGEGTGGTFSASDTDSARVIVSAPELRVQQTVGLDPRSCGTDTALTVPAGIDVYFCLTVTNTGDTTLRSHQLEAPALGISTEFDFVLEEGNSLTLFEASLSTFGINESFAVEAIPNDIESVMTLTSTTAEGVQTEASATATVDTAGRMGALVWKQASTVPDDCLPVTSVFINTPIYYCVIVTNLGSATLTTHQLTDPQLNLDTTLDVAIAPNEKFSFTADFVNELPGIDDNFGPYTMTTPILNTLYYTGSVANGFSISKVVTNFVDIGTPALVEPSITPTPTETGTPTLTPTWTPTQRPPNTATSFPTNTPGPTLSPTPVPLPPTHTPISPPPTPTATPTTLIARGVQTPTPPAIAANTGQEPVALTATANSQQATAVSASQTEQASSGMATATAAAALSLLATPTPMPTDTVEPTATPTGTSTETPTPTPSPTPTPTATYAARATSTPVPVDTPTATQVAAAVLAPDRPLVQSAAPPPSSYMSYLAQMVNAFILTAGFLWFMCGSVIFFLSAGLATGIYFRRQERNRYQLMQVPDAEETQPLTGTGSLSSASAQYQWEYDEGSARSSSRRESDDDSNDDHWPASLP